MSVSLRIKYRCYEDGEITMSNEDHTRLVVLGAYTAIGVMASPDGSFWYSDRFLQPSAHDGMVLSTHHECQMVLNSLKTILHYLTESEKNHRPWVTHKDRNILERRLIENLIQVLHGATAVYFS